MHKELFGPPGEEHRRTWIWAIPILVVVFMIGAQLLVLLSAKNMGLITRETIGVYPQVLYLFIGAFAMAALLLIVWIRFFERRDLASAGLALSGDTRKFYLRGYASGLLMAASVVAGVGLLGGYTVEADVGIDTADLVPIVVLMFAFMLQAGTEEFVFRGWMLGRIAERYGLWAGVIGNSVLFMLMHVDTERLAVIGTLEITIFLFATLLFSVFVSLLVIRERSIWGAAAWHASWNWIFITWFGLPTTGIDLGLSPLITDLAAVPDAAVWVTGGTDGPEGSFLTPLVLAAACLILILRRRG